MDYKAEKIMPYGKKESKTQQVREMFDSIAPVYDFMNRAMTFGIDKLWRRKAVGFLRRKGVQSLLDVATGTGDFAMLLCRKLHPKRWWASTCRKICFPSPSRRRSAPVLTM